MIPVSVLAFDIDPEPGFDPGRAPGSSLRGALYMALNTLYDTNQPVESRYEMDDNPVGWLLRLQDDDTSGGKDVPRPIAVRPFLDNTPNTFALAFYGQARETIPMVVSAVPVMGQIGVGNGRRKFVLRGVRSIDPITGQSLPLLDAAGKATGSVPEPPGAAAYQQMAALLTPDAVTVRFLTPTRIIQQGRLSHEPVFRAWFQRLLERLRLISEVYTAEPVWIPFRDLLAAADVVTICRDDTHWHESWSGSRRDGMVKPLGGFIGSVQYAGPLRDLLPYLLLGQALQVGKNTIKGCGWYEVALQWARP